MSLTNALNAAVSKQLKVKLAAEFTAKFDLEEEKVTEFLTEFFSQQLQNVKGHKKPKLDENGNKIPGRVSGYIVYSNVQRAQIKADNPSITIPEIAKKLGDSWKSLDDEEKADWNKKAFEINTKNGITPGRTPKATPAKKGKAAPAKQAKATPAKQSKAPAKQAKAAPAKAAPAKQAKPAPTPAKQAKAAPAKQAKAPVKPIQKKKQVDSDDDE
jgi:mRNA-degrading endonuclease RelE of RelBE toxin-antitoxin system